MRTATRGQTIGLSAPEGVSRLQADAGERDGFPHPSDPGRARRGDGETHPGEGRRVAADAGDATEDPETDEGLPLAPSPSRSCPAHRNVYVKPQLSGPALLLSSKKAPTALR
nr:uncharacterized protein LOC106731930 isoform X1 [Pelodiscus sinensis]|eukprot:XP_025039759.1 uncharacterized protein LOC106731930 isoform X1 [Pelodiscus sinensis]